MKIAHVASESNPLAKTGGLGDVVYSLSKSLIKLGNEVVVVLPFYDSVQRNHAYKFDFVTSFFVNMSWRHEEASIYETYIDGIKFYLIGNRRYFARPHFYGDYDDGERFAFFTLAAKELFKVLNEKVDIIHVHDWQVGMLPCLLKETHDDFYKDTKTVLTIHNPAFQGMFPRSCLGDFYSLPDYLYDNGSVRFNDQVSTLKSGIVYADKITTVSLTYRKELLTPEGGMGLNSILDMRQFDFYGIVNGIDYETFNPEDDKDIVSHYNITNVSKNKKENKYKLCEEFGFVNKDAPLFSVVSRLTWQKGIDLLDKLINRLLDMGANVFILGSGEYQYERRNQDLADASNGRMRCYIGYSEALSHQVYAASDFILMPSLYEPCGISQMLAQRYGALPIVRLTGGLEDTVIPFNRFNLDKANGFGFHPYNTDDFAVSLRMAVDSYKDKKVHEQLVKNAMSVDNSWTKSAIEYLNLYKSMK